MHINLAEPGFHSPLTMNLLFKVSGGYNLFYIIY